MIKRGALLICLLTAFMTNSAMAETSKNLKVGTFNVRWFGSPEHDQKYQLPSTKPERIAAVKDFLAKEILPLDVMAFQEIIDMKALKAILPKGWKCASYNHEFDLHQRIAICVSKNYSLKKVPYDDDTLINETAYYDANRARPSVRVDIADKKGTRILRVVAVHLKSAPHFARLRLKQVGMIGRDLQNDSEIPMIVMGDFNSYPKDKTGLEADDVKLIEKQLNQSGAGFKHIQYKAAHTFRNKRGYGQFDHFFVNKRVSKTTKPQIFSVCNQKQDGNGYLNADHYLRYVSDHCPVKMEINL